MSVDSAKAFLAKIGSDEALRNQLMSAADDEARKQIAKDAGFEFTKADFQAASGMDPDKLLSGEDLDQIAGGTSDIAEVGIDVGINAGTDVVCSAAASAL